MSEGYLTIARAVFNLAAAVFFLLSFSRLSYAHEGGTKKPVVEQISFMVLFHHRVGWVLIAF
jgi:hypothetical protein